MQELLTALSPGEAPVLPERRVPVTLIDRSDGHRVPHTAAGSYPAFQQTEGGKGQLISIHIQGHRVSQKKCEVRAWPI